MADVMIGVVLLAFLLPREAIDLRSLTNEVVCNRRRFRADQGNRYQRKGGE
jgi:hypothetical protein